jgi:fructan beta-fructosidase
MTIPRKLSLRERADGIRIVQEASSGLRTLRLDGFEWRDEQIVPGSNLLSGHKGELFEIAAEFEMDTAAEFGFKLRTSDEYETVVGYDTADSQLFIDRTKSGIIDFHTQFGCRHSSPLEPEDGRIKLQLWVDRSSVEVFADNGGLVMTDQLFPLDGSDGIELYAKGGSVRLHSLQLYPLKSTYKPMVTETVGK